MRFVIVENKLSQIINKFLSDEYGGLIRYDDKNRYDLSFFIKNTGREPHKNDIVFFYNKDSQSAYIPWNMVDDIRMFTGDEWKSKTYIMNWMKETYGINPVKLYEDF